MQELLDPMLYAGMDYQAKIRMRRELNLTNQFNNPTPDLEKIIEAVAEHQNIKVEHIKSKSRLFDIKIARFYYFYLCRLLTDFSFDRIGAVVGRNHATVLHGNNKIKDWLSYDKQVIQDLEELETKIKGE